MKKIVLFSLLTVAALSTTSCSNEEIYSNESQDNAIEFSTYVGRDAITRGSVFDTDALKGDDGGFGVYAFYTGQNTWETASSATPAPTPNFMCNQKVAYNSSNSAWEYTPVKYWPNNTDDKVSFFAYAPYNGTDTHITPSQNSVAGAPTVTFTVDDAVKKQQDLVVADAQTDKTKQSITGDVNFTFKHVLSRIGLNVEAMVDNVNGDATGSTDNGTTQNGSIADKTTIKVKEVKLIGKFDKEATIDLTSSTWNLGDAATDEVTYTWSSEKNNFADVADNVTTTKTKLNADDSYAMIIPQSFTGEDNKIKLKVTYTVTTEDSELPGEKSEITNTIESTPFTFTFEKGKAYTFNLHLGMTSVKFSATVSDWGSETETVVNVPINTSNN